MKKKTISFMLAVSIFGLAYGQAQNQSSGMQSDKDKDWVKIGEKSVTLSDNRSIFNWATDREKSINANEKYAAIKFKAKDATVNMTDIEVEYEDGHKQNLSINTPVMVNSESKTVFLDKEKELDKITFNFKMDETAQADKAKVELWGLKSEGSGGMGSSEDRESSMMRSDKDNHMRSDKDNHMRSDKDNDMKSDKDKGWVKIGEKTVDLSEDRGILSGIFDWDTDREKTINANERYSAVKFKAKDATVNMTNVEVEYDDGQKRKLNIDSPVRANSESKIVTLDDDRKLDKITFNFLKDETALADKATVELWGLKAEGSGGMGQRNDSDIDIDACDK